MASAAWKREAFRPQEFQPGLRPQAVPERAGALPARSTRSDQSKPGPRSFPFELRQQLSVSVQSRSPITCHRAGVLSDPTISRAALPSEQKWWDPTTHHFSSRFAVGTDDHGVTHSSSLVIDHQLWCTVGASFGIERLNEKHSPTFEGGMLHRRSRSSDDLSELHG